MFASRTYKRIHDAYFCLDKRSKHTQGNLSSNTNCNNSCMPHSYQCVEIPKFSDNA